MVRLLQIGIGGMGNAWLAAAGAVPEAELIGFVEINPQIAAAQAAKYGLDPGRIFPSLEAALAAVRADGVVIVTPPQTHRDLSVAAMRAGLPVLSEKPLADTRPAAEAIVHTAEETGMLHMVAQNYRYRASIQTMRRLLASGELGAVASVAVEFFRGPHFGGFRETMPYPLITDMVIHHFDLLRFFLGADPVAVYGRSWNPPWSWFQGDAAATVLLEFAGGIVASYDGSWCSMGRETSWNADWRFECARGVLALQDDRVTIQVAGQEPAPVATVVMARENQAALLHEFCAAVAGGSRPATTGQDNLHSLAIVFDTIASFQSGSRVRCGETEEQ